jgi:lipopolysaccharide transport system ATP-binding protein
MVAVSFDNVSKKFARGLPPDSLRDLIPSLIRRSVQRRADTLKDNEFWALRDVSFEVEQGKALGIIGPNGAGKSTVLKLLTRILKPTTGTCIVRGRTGALIEIAAGFHPDLTGRENVFLQGAIMGMKPREVEQRFSEIVEFSGVSAFIDTPVKRYSSGMGARLGFAIAAHLNPQVLIIDEVLGVGDMAFQQKCIDRMNDFKRQGVAIVFVSHNLEAVSNLCDSTLYLKSSVVAHGDTVEVLRQYVANQAQGNATSSHEAEFSGVSLTDRSGSTVSSVAPGTPLEFQLTCALHRDVREAHFGFLVHRSTDNLVVYGGHFHASDLGYDGLRAGQVVQLAFQFRPNLTRGQYHIECYVHDDIGGDHLVCLSPAALFSVSETRSCSGIADLDVQVTASSPGVAESPAVSLVQ